MKIASITMSSLITLTAIGSINQLPQIPYIVIGAVIIVTLLVAFNKINIKYLPIYIFGLALSLLYQTSMLGSHIVGVDIHTEYFVANEIINNGWDVNWVNNSNSSIVLAWFTPFLNWIGISPTWAFKAVYPIACAGAPVVLYYAFKKIISEKKAYFSCLFLITMPMFTMEVVSIVKSEWAYLFVATAVFFITSEYKPWVKALGISTSAIMTILTHYSVGTVMLYYAITTLVVMVIANWLRIKWIVRKYRMPLRYTAIVTVSIMLAYVVWFSSIGQGSMLKVAFAIVGNVTEVTQEVSSNELTTSSNSGTLEQYLEYTKPTETAKSYLDLQSPLIRTAIGLDFNTVPIWGKLFRTAQYLTQAFMIIGLIAVLVRYRYYLFPMEYIVSLVVSFGLLLACIFIPFLTTALSTTRFYAITLFFIAPLVIIGIEESVRITSQWIKRRQLA